MSVRERPADRGLIRGERLLADLLHEIREARVGAGLSQDSVGRAVGLSKSRISAIERGGSRSVPLVVIAQLLAVVGLDLSARAYPIGGGLRDAGQARLLGRLRLRVHQSVAWRTEVPVTTGGDLRAWDCVLGVAGLTIGVDAETRLRDFQAIDRRTMLKLRDGSVDRALLLIADTHANRAALRELGGLVFANYPILTRRALEALSAGRDPGGNAIVVL